MIESKQVTAQVEKERIMRDHTKLRAFELAGDIAHDFNNIIQFISGFAEFLLLDKKKWAKRRMTLTMKKINR